MEAANWISRFPLLDYTRHFAHDFVAQIIRTGPIPKHIAFVMDGNRRFAKKNRLESGEGHFAGFETFIRIAQACSQLKIRTVTVYAFSIENFARKKEESELLFNMMRTKLWDMAKDGDSIANKNGWRIKVLGNRSLLEPDILERIEKIEELTKDNDSMTINICCPYTSRDDLAQAIRSLAQARKDGDIALDSIDTPALEGALYMNESDPLDILVRTSGETRLSDFMCWESVAGCEISFVPTLWPEFSVWELYMIVLRWGYHQSRAQASGRLRVDQLPQAPPAVSVSDKRCRN